MKRSAYITPVCGAILAVLAFLVYLNTILANGLTERSAATVGAITGFLPRPLPLNPVWTFLVSIISGLTSASGTVISSCVLSAIMGAASVGLVFELLSSLLWEIVDCEDPHRPQAGVAVVLASLAASVSTALCAPFWYASTTARPDALHVLILLICARLLVSFAKTGRVWLLCVLAFFYGIGVAEFETMILLLPVAALAVLFFMLKHAVLKAWSVTAAPLCGLLALSVYLFAAHEFCGQQFNDIYGYAGTMSVVKHVLIKQYALLRINMFGSGWLLVLALTCVPFALAMGIGRRALNQERDATYVCLHIMMTVAVVLVVLNTPLSPWRLGGFARVQVTPYILAALLVGYLVAFWMLWPSEWWADTETQWRISFRKWIGLLFAAPLIVLVCYMPLRNIEFVESSSSAFAEKCVNDMLNAINLSDRPSEREKWLITDGSLDGILAVKVHDAGLNLKTMNASLSNSGFYQRYMSSLFTDPELKSMSRAGIGPLFATWISSGESPVNSVFLQTHWSLWMSQGVTAYPAGLLYLAAQANEQLDPDSVFAKNSAVWDSVPVEVLSCTNPVTPSQYLNQYLVRQLSRSANNLGVILQARGEEKLAAEAYNSSLKLNPDNLSALLNLRAMEKEGSAEYAEVDLDAEIERLELEWDSRRGLGYIRSVLGEIYENYVVATGVSGLLSAGMSDKALSRLRKKIRRGERQDLSDYLVANVYSANGLMEEAAAVYKELLNQSPDDVLALTGLAVLSIGSNDLTTAGSYVGKAEVLNKEALPVRRARISLMIARGETANAVAELNQILGDTPNLPEMWTLLVDVLVRSGEAEALNQVVARLRRLSAPDYVKAYASGYASLLAGSNSSAKLHFLNVLRYRPSLLSLRETVLRLCLSDKDEEEMRQQIEILLSVDPKNSLANYALARKLQEKKELELAETAFRRALMRERSVPVLNDLAFLLHERGKHAEAECLIREALSKEDSVSALWDTLGLIQAAQGYSDKALQSFQKGYALQDKDANVSVHYAEALAARGETTKAAEVLKEIDDSSLSEDSEQRLKQLRKMLK